MEKSEIYDEQNYGTNFAHSPRRVRDWRPVSRSAAPRPAGATSRFSNLHPGHEERMQRLIERAAQRLPLFS